MFVVAVNVAAASFTLLKRIISGAAMQEHARKRTRSMDLTILKGKLYLEFYVWQVGVTDV
jgi:hypothetical protein